jgi:lipopolysaccharide export LptBFGC system permease protein LptF
MKKLTFLEQIRKNFQDYQKEQLFVEDLNNLIANTPELNKNSEQYNKELDNFLDYLLTNSDNSINTDKLVSEIYYKLKAINL